MDIKEAEELYKRYNCWNYMIDRDEPDKCKQLEDMHLSSEIYEKWRQERLETLFESTNEQKLWIRITDAARIMKDTTSRQKENGIKLIELLTEANKSDPDEKKIILKTITGERNHDGMIVWYQKYTDLSDKLKLIIKELS